MKAKFKMKHLLYVSLITFASCSSPSGDGAKAAKLENQYAKECIEALHTLESEFVTNFNPDAYTYRQQALDEYTKRFNKICDTYYSNLDLAEIQASKLKKRHTGDYSDIQEFEAGYLAAKDIELQVTATKLTLAENVPAAVVASIDMIVPPTPDEARIMSDFEGHTMSEGFERSECYFSENWSLTVGDEVSISDLKIDNVVRKDKDDYVINASFVLNMEYLSFNAKAQVYYTLPSGADWKMDFVKSRGVRIIQTHKYDDCIQCAIEDDGWGGIDALFITNTSEVQLIVVGHITPQDSEESVTFNTIIPAGQKTHVGGLFDGGSVVDYDIVLVERES